MDKVFKSTRLSIDQHSCLYRFGALGVVLLLIQRVAKDLQLVDESLESHGKVVDGHPWTELDLLVVEAQCLRPRLAHAFGAES